MRDLATVMIGDFFVIKGFTYGNSFSPIHGGLIKSDVRLDVGMPVIIAEVSSSNEDGIRWFELLTPDGFVRIFAGPTRWKSIFGDQ